ncbi:MAG TPA: gliding motility-associated C-terminal domain-containing protein [Chitinophagaceae bacterium]|nr:gliding motility-associated C-terminal domain-containing protein [Chitinophagaceae bacterium]
MRKATLYLYFIAHVTCLKAQQYLPPNQRAGELSYLLVNSTNDNGSPNIYYHFTLKMVVECQFLEPAIGELFINDFDKAGPSKQYDFELDSASNRVDVADPCIAFSYPPCYRVYYYHCDVPLAFNKYGYSAVYADCCRDFFQNLSINDRSLSSYEGADLQRTWICGGLTYFWPCVGPVYNSIAFINNIPSRFTWLYNSSPTFENSSDTILYVCINNTFSHTFKAVDPDGDSLVYSFSPARIWSVGIGGPGGKVKINTVDDFYDIDYSKPKYTAQQPMGSEVSIDALTGNLHGVIRDTGTFLATLAVYEYRNGKKVSLTPHTRDVLIKAFDCSKLAVPAAKLPTLLNNCDSNTIMLPNLSTPYHPELYWDNNKYLWSLGDGSTSTLRYPVHKYDTGTYSVQLITMPGYRCADTADMKLLVYPAVHPRFAVSGQTCTDQSLKFTNLSSTDIGYINNLKWTFTNLRDSTNFTSTLSSPTYTFRVPNQTYSAVLDITTTKGCEASDTQYINIWQSPLPFTVHDTVITAGVPYQLFANPGYDSANNVFIWSPATGLDNPFIANPVAAGSNDITYRAEITNAFGCYLTDTIHLVYYKGPDIYVPNAFTPNGDGVNDIFRPFPVGIKKLEYFRVFSRWGNMVYQTQVYLAGWDGNIKGRQAPPGTYIYEVRGKDYNGKAVFKKGSVLLVR